MQKSAKIVTGVLVAVLVIGGFALAGRSELFKGMFNYTPIEAGRLYLDRDKIVSAIASPVTSRVPSVVTSDVTSRGGTSRVASVVVSGVTSPVASAVALSERDAERVDTRGLQSLTASILESVAKADQAANKAKYDKAGQDYIKNNPAQFTLSEKEKASLIELYKKENPLEFIFRPATR